MRIDNGVITRGEDGFAGENRGGYTLVGERSVNDGVGDTYASDVDGAGAKESFEDGEEHGSGSSRRASLSFRRAFLDMRTRGRMEPSGRQRRVVKRGVTLPVWSIKRLTSLRR